VDIEKVKRISELYSNVQKLSKKISWAESKLAEKAFYLIYSDYYEFTVLSKLELSQHDVTVLMDSWIADKAEIEKELAELV